MGSTWQIVALSVPTTTTREDIFDALNDIVANNKVEWTRCIENNPVFALEMTCTMKFVYLHMTKQLHHSLQ
jgi:hypothetical protein